MSSGPNRHGDSARDSQWETNFRALVAFHGRHGHFVVPGWASQRPLHLWARYQRLRFRQGKLPRDRYQRLLAAGFPFEQTTAIANTLVGEPRWNERFLALKAFATTHGHFSLLRRSKGPLARWVSTQRQLQRKGWLPPDRERLLRSIGFPFRSDRSAVLRVRYRHRWDEWFETAREFRRRQGRLAPPWQGQVTLREWLRRQCEARRGGELDPRRVRRLSSLGFSWDMSSARREAEAARWRASLAALAAFRKAHGHFAVPRSGATRTLATWVEVQRGFYRKGRLAKERLAALRSLGLSFEDARRSPPPLLHQPAWDRRFDELAKFRERHGHLHVGAGPGRGSRLAVWCDRQRALWRGGKLPKEREVRLTRLGFDFALARAAIRWGPTEAHLEQLKAFRRRHGHVAVPFVPAYRALHLWLADRRAERRGGVLAPELRAALTGLSVPLTAEEVTWERRFALAADLQRRHGKKAMQATGVLGRWLAGERRRFAKGTLPLDREKRLVQVGLLP